MLKYAMPEIDGSAQEQLLLHHFLVELYLTIDKQYVMLTNWRRLSNKLTCRYY